MKAAVLHGREDIRIESVPVPKAGVGEIIVQVGLPLSLVEPISRSFVADTMRG